MAITFAVRGDSFTARYNMAKQSAVAMKGGNGSTTVPVIYSGADAGLIGGSAIDLNRGVDAASGGKRFVAWPSAENIGTGIARSYLVRVAFGETAQSMGIVRVGSPYGDHFNFQLFYLSTGNLRAQIYDQYGTLIQSVTYAWTPVVGTYYDIVAQWDGTTGANKLKLWIDGTNVASATAGSGWTAPIDTNVLDNISLGSFTIAGVTCLRINEFVIWDSYITPTSVALVSGTGSLNGASRTSLVDVTSFDGSNYTDPGTANVLSGTGYYFHGNAMTGTLAVGSSTDPGAANVLSGTVYLISGTTYTGSYHNPTNTSPGITNVKRDVSWIYNDSTLTGTWNYPESNSGTAGTVDTNGILEYIRYLVDEANTTTASNYLSTNLTTKVQKVLKVNPVQIPLQPSFYPFVTCHIVSKEIEKQDIASNQLNAKRQASVIVDVVGAVWNANFQRDTEDPAANDINYLMENLELVLRSSPTLGSKVKWQVADAVTYDGAKIDEQTHLRAGVIKLKGTVFY